MGLLCLSTVDAYLAMHVMHDYFSICLPVYNTEVQYYYLFLMSDRAEVRNISVCHTAENCQLYSPSYWT